MREHLFEARAMKAVCLKHYNNGNYFFPLVES
jgi:hypothetical protein